MVDSQEVPSIGRIATVLCEVVFGDTLGRRALTEGGR